MKSQPFNLNRLELGQMSQGIRSADSQHKIQNNQKHQDRIQLEQQIN